ncbi:MAG: hypothetical protein SFZ23_04775 [Planctomycetota bacterium]|nr:hypothetical protein [Planctomycetota bacterium]
MASAFGSLGVAPVWPASFGWAKAVGLRAVGLLAVGLALGRPLGAGEAPTRATGSRHELRATFAPRATLFGATAPRAAGLLVGAAVGALVPTAASTAIVPFFARSLASFAASFQASAFRARGLQSRTTWTARTRRAAEIVTSLAEHEDAFPALFANL